MPDANGNPVAGERDAQGRTYFPGMGWSGGSDQSFQQQGFGGVGVQPPAGTPPPPPTPGTWRGTTPDGLNWNTRTSGAQLNDNPTGRGNTPFLPPPDGGNPTSRGNTPWGYGGQPPPNSGGFQFDPTGFGSAGQFKLDPAVEQAYRFALQQAMQRYQDPSANRYYGGQTVAGLTPDELAAQQKVRGAVPGMEGMIGSVGDYYKSMLQQPGQANPAMEAAIQAMRNSSIKSFQDPGGPMANIRQDAMGGGQYGGTRQGIAEGLAMGRLGDTLTGNEANMRYQDLSAQYGRAASAASALPGYLQTSMAPAAALAGVGAQNRDIQQQQIGSDMNKWAYENSMPDTRIQNLINSIGGTAPIGGTNYSQQYTPSWYSDMLKSGGGPAGGSGNNWLAALAGAFGLYNTFTGK